jgi:hypothetical protein
MNRILSLSMAIFALTVMDGRALSQDLPAAARYRVEVGKAHPDFALPRIDNGRPLRLSDYRGKKVLLVHFASW